MIINQKIDKAKILMTSKISVDKISNHATVNARTTSQQQRHADRKTDVKKRHMEGVAVTISPSTLFSFNIKCQNFRINIVNILITQRI